jgi:hypothetical protein
MKCRVVGCLNDKIMPTEACQEHAAQWNKHVNLKSKSTVSGIRRILQRPGERQTWQRGARPAVQLPHDEDAPDDVERKTYFSPNRYYCVETLCAPCGVIHAWTKFAKAESPTNILGFLDDNFPTEESCPSFACIDKGCQVLRTAMSNGSWHNKWEKTTRFIVDSYHYTNHKASDELCRTYCNPAPTDGTQPNLVGQKINDDGAIIYFREFNTQICEQLNAWLGGFESILKRMTSKNFNWFLHVMLFYHVKYVLAKKSPPGPPPPDDQDDDDEDDNSDTNDSGENEKSSESDKEASGKSSGEISSESDEEETSESDEEETSESEEEESINNLEKNDEESEENSTESDDSKESSTIETNNEMVGRADDLMEDEEEDDLTEDDKEEDDPMDVDDD